MKKFIFVLSVLLLVLPFSVLGAVSYERTPAGYYIYNPVTFSISGLLEEYEGLSFQIRISGKTGGSRELCSISNEVNWEVNFDIGSQMTDVEWWVFDELNCEGNDIAEGYFETNGIIFEIIEAPSPPVANFVPISGSFIAGVVAYINDLAIGIWTIIALVIGVPLAFWVIGKVIEIPKLKK